MKNNIRVGSAGLITYNDKLLMGVRGKEPNYGKWILPGGGVDFGEQIQDTLKREIFEECNISIKDINNFKYYELINLPNEHRIIFYFNAKYDYGQIKPQSDLLDVNFLTKQEIQEFFIEDKISPFVVKVLKESKWIE